MKKLMQFFFGLGFIQSVWAVPLETLPRIDGKSESYTIQSDTQLVFFWGTWCTTCKEKLQSFLPEIDSRPGIDVVTVNLDKDVGRARNYVEKNRIKLPALYDSEKKLRQELKVFSVPHWAVYKKGGQGLTLVDSAPAFEVERIEKALQSAIQGGGT